MKSGIDRIGFDVTTAQAKRKCFDKVRYTSKTAARDEAARKQNRHPEWEPARPYRCSLCSGFHLTTSITGQPKGKALKPRGLRVSDIQQSSGGKPSKTRKAA